MYQPKYNPTFNLFIYDNKTDNEKKELFVMDDKYRDAGVIGNDFGNTIYGNKHNNIIDGGEGADFMAGGKGNDVYVVDSIDDIAFEQATEGSDLIRSYLETGFDLTTTPYVEGLFLMAGTQAIGNSLHNLISANNAANTVVGGLGNDTINGGDGSDDIFGEADNDWLDGGLGRDIMTGSIGDDNYVIDNAADVVVEQAGEGTDTVNSLISHTLADNFENLTLKDHVWSWVEKNINGTGNDVANKLTGNSGNNTLLGNDGHDTIDGGLGKDILAGGEGKDAFVFRAFGSKNADQITDFNTSNDAIWLDGAVFKKVDCGCSTKPMTLKEKFFTIGSDAQDDNDYIIADIDAGKLYYDADGSDAACEKQLIATFDRGTDLTSKHFFVI